MRDEYTRIPGAVASDSGGAGPGQDAAVAAEAVVDDVGAVHYSILVGHHNLSIESATGELAGSGVANAIAQNLSPGSHTGDSFAVTGSRGSCIGSARRSSGCMCAVRAAVRTRQGASISWQR